jgi:DNA repair protein RadC
LENIYVREALPKENMWDDLKGRFEKHGAEALRDGELLVLMDIRPGKVAALLDTMQIHELPMMSVEKLASQLSPSEARKLICCFELSKRAFQRNLGILPVISCPSEALPFLSHYKDLKKEHFICLFLNARHQVIHQEVISIGSLSASIVHPREVFLPAIQHSSACIILVHNHPSGDVSPSQDDIDMTKRLDKAGDLLGIQVLDHLIVASEDYCSLKESGLI